MTQARRAVSQDFTRLTLNSNPLSDAGETRLRPPVRGASPSLGGPGAHAQQAEPGAQRCAFPWSLFPTGNPRAPRKGSTGERRGAARAPPRAPLGGRTERRGNQRLGLGANGGSRARWTGNPRPGHPRGSRHREARSGCAPHARLARRSPRLGTPQLGSRAGRAREFPGRPGAGRGGGLSPVSVSPAPPAASPAPLPHRPPPSPRGRAPRPCPGGAASARRAPHGARAAIATHRGRRGSRPPIRVAPSFPG